MSCGMSSSGNCYNCSWPARSWHRPCWKIDITAAAAEFPAMNDRGKVPVLKLGMAAAERNATRKARAPELPADRWTRAKTLQPRFPASQSRATRHHRRHRPVRLPPEEGGF